MTVDSFIIQQGLGLELEVLGDPPLDRTLDYIVLSNHSSWFDILLLQHANTLQGPILKFLIKQELIYVPVVDWICLVLDFPRLNRGKTEGARQKDYYSVSNAARSPGAPLNLAKARALPERNIKTNNLPTTICYSPAVGGYKIMLENQLRVTILDVTLVYPVEGLSFWDCLSGHWRTFKIQLRYFSPNDIDDPQTWLEKRWKEKDRQISQTLSTTMHG